MLAYLGEENAYRELTEGGSSGFDALLSGVWLSHGEFFGQGTFTRFWSDTGFIRNTAWTFYLHDSMEKAGLHYEIRCDGFSVRCIRE